MTCRPQVLPRCSASSVRLTSAVLCCLKALTQPVSRSWRRPRLRPPPPPVSGLRRGPALLPEAASRRRVSPVIQEPNGCEVRSRPVTPSSELHPGAEKQAPPQSSRLPMSKKAAVLPRSCGFASFLLFVGAFKVTRNGPRARAGFGAPLCAPLFRAAPCRGKFPDASVRRAGRPRSRPRRAAAPRRRGRAAGPGAPLTQALARPFAQRCRLPANPGGCAPGRGQPAPGARPGPASPAPGRTVP